LKPNDPKLNSSFVLPYYVYDWTKLQDSETLYSTGANVNFNLTGSSKALFASTDLAKAELQAKWITSIGSNNNYRLILRGEIGAISAREFSKIPVSMRFFTGGDYSVRGFAYKSLGTTEIDLDGNEVVVGSKYKLIGSTEFERRIKEEVAIAAFVDAGNAMDRLNESCAVSTGVGVRLLSKIGAFRIDIAKPLTNTNSTRHLRLHINFGKDL
jgi:translocation and assembly module TamA